ncbi:lipopolysaccharide biosynthesis protein [Arthrobacter sp. AQ5-05]|uniref:lipopolysaccharide biosynthesis protein n=1 Tax=Arthrobacter sp. AQ5-05 TaxID=2184581 RepID=UPI0018A72425|nr:oligosaccharide flippase family protein [Arthrobacter sp. AQ5-05]
MSGVGEGRISRWRRSEFLRHILTLLTGTVAAQLLMLALTPVLSRLYSPEAYGLFSLYSSLVATVTVVAALRYDMAIMLPKHDADAKVLKRGVTWLIVAVSVVATVVCGLSSPIIANAMGKPDLAPWLWFVGLSIFTLAEISALTYWLNRRSDYKAIGINRVLQSGGTALAQLALALGKFGGVGGLIGGTLVGQTAALLILRHKGRDVRQGLDESQESIPGLFKRYRRMPLLNGPNALVDAVRTNGINLIIGIVYSQSMLGQFYMAWKLLEVPLGLINGALAQVFFQRLAVMERGTMFAFAKTTVYRSAVLGIIPFVLIYWLSPWAFPVVLGAQWADAGLIARALVPWLFMSLITSPISTIFVVTETQHLMLAHALVYTAVPLSLLFFLKGDIVANLTAVSWAMAAILVAFTVMALWVGRRFDRGLDLKAAVLEG